MARTGTGNFLPQSWFSWQKLFIWLCNFSPNRPNPWLVSKVLGNLFLITLLVPSVFCGCWRGGALLLGDICSHVTVRNREPQWFPEVKLPANLCVCVCGCVVSYFSLSFMWYPSCPKLHHHHPDINSSYSHSRQPCCSYLRAGAVEFLIVLPQDFSTCFKPMVSWNQGLSLKIILSISKNTEAAASACDKLHSLFNLFKLSFKIDAIFIFLAEMLL